MDALEAGLKLATFAGVLLSASALHMRREEPRVGVALGLLGAVGVTLMVANRWIVDLAWLAVTVDACYLFACARAFVWSSRGHRSGQSGAVHP